MGMGNGYNELRSTSLNVMFLFVFVLRFQSMTEWGQFTMR